jgi:hypothetical protein
MRPGQVAIDLWMILVVASLVSIILFLVLGVLWALAAAIAGGRRLRRVSAKVSGLARGCSVGDLADIDEALDRMLTEDHGLLI